MKIILRRDYVGDPFCENLKAHLPGFEIINKDRQTIPTAEIVIRWGTTSSVPGDPTVLNSAKAIHRVFNKGEFRRAMADQNIAPKTFSSFSEFLDDQIYPVIIRPNHHSRSENLHFCEDLTGVCKAIAPMKDFYISEYVEKDEEYRVFVVAGKAIAVIKKLPKNKKDVSWGCVTQGNFEYVPWTSWPLDVVQKACLAFNLSKLDFGAVDVLSKDSVGYVLEINTAPELTPYYGKCLAKALQYTLDNSRDTLLIEGNTWQSYIHPAIGA